MNTNREKTSSVLGLVISVLLHGIFLAGCVAIEFNLSHDDAAAKTDKSEITKVASHIGMAKLKS
ncbi:MAG: hypothetical protein ABIQ02_09375 [Saprospiraceae bacterium]